MGGLLVDFQGRPPRLGARIRISGGKIIGRVDTVIGPVGSALIHVHPLYDGIDARASVGSPVEIAPREQPSQRRSRGRHSGGNFREGGGGRSYRDNKGGGNRGRGPNNLGRKTGNTGRRRDSGKSGRGNKRR